MFRKKLNIQRKFVFINIFLRVFILGMGKMINIIIFIYFSIYINKLLFYAIVIYKKKKF